MSAAAAFVLGMGVGAILVPLATWSTSIWYERVYLPKLNGDD